MAAGNWKMNKTEKETEDFFKKFLAYFNPKITEKADVILFPPHTSLDTAMNYSAYGIKIGAQNIHWEDRGAFTGEISADFIIEKGCRYVIVGHSERRKYFCETDETVNKKLKKSLEKKLIPIFCIGETLEEREDNRTFEVIKRQLKKGFEGIENVKETIIAYEPVWAIGTGKRAEVKDIVEVHSFIRDEISKIYSKELAENMRILYGGSVKPENIEELMKEPEIDGTLVGGASLEAEFFYKIVEVTAMKGGDL